MISTEDVIELYREMVIFSAFCKKVSENGSASMDTIAAELGFKSGTTITNAIVRLSKRVGAELAIIHPGSKFKHITEEGQDLAQRGEKLVESCKELLDGVRGSVRIVTSASLEAFVHPGAVALFRSQPKWAEVDLKFEQQHDWRLVLQQLRTRSTDISIHWLTPQRNPDLWSSSIRDALLEEFTFETFKPHFPMVAIMLPSHPLAIRAEGTGKSVTFRELADFPVYHLPPGRQPLFDRVPNGSAARIEVSSYEKALNYVRLGPTLGVSLVPFMPSLDEARRRMEIAYVSLDLDEEEPGSGGVQVAVCMRKPGRSRLSPAALAYLQAFERHLASIPRVPGMGWSRYLLPLPKDPEDIINYGHIYFVSSSGGANSSVRWREATVHWVKPQLYGDTYGTPGTLTLVDPLPGSDTRLQYEVRAFLTGTQDKTRLLHITGTCLTEVNGIRDHFITVYNTADHPQHTSCQTLVGAWSGRDDKMRPTTAPSVLSTGLLNPAQIAELSRRVTTRFMTSAPFDGASVQNDVTSSFEAS